MSPFKDAKLRIYLLAGQSNMVGHGRTLVDGNDPSQVSLTTLVANGDEPASLLAARDDVFIVFQGRKSGYVDPSFGQTDIKFGPEVGLGQVLGDAFDGPILFYKVAEGGTSLNVDWRPPSAGGNTGAWYNTMNEEFSRFLVNIADNYPDYQGQEVVLAGFIWLQGFDDYFNGFPDLYEDNLIALIEDVRTEFGEELPVVVVQSPEVANVASATTLTNARIGAVNAVNEAIPEKAVYLETFPRSDYGAGPQLHHWNENATRYLNAGRYTGNLLIERGFY